MEKITITRIEFQNKRKKTYSLYEEVTFLTEINEDTLVHFAISKNAVFSEETFDQILEYDQINSCLTQAYNYLQRRPHLKKELSLKLTNKQFSKEIIEKTFHKLEQKTYINDDEYIKMYIRDSVRIGKSGPNLIKKKLIEKGAVVKDIENNLDELFPFEVQLKIATEIINKKISRLNEPNNMQRKQKLQQYGMNKGFTWNVLERIINSLHFSE